MKTKFRGLVRKESKVYRVILIDWIYKDIVVCPLDIIVSEPKDIAAGTTKNFDFKEVKLLPYINIKDKNGKEVYYNDLIKDLKANTYTVELDTKGGLYCLKPTKKGTPAKELLLIKEECETLGNVEENLHILIPNK